MHNNYILTGILCGMFVIALTSGTAKANMDPIAGIQFPIAELGGCGSKGECKTYCDAPTNVEACISFAEKNKLMSEKEITAAKKFIAAGAKGPGGCTGKESCEAYCNDFEHIDACVAFAEENGFMAGEELQEAKKVQAAIKRGVTPPACRGKEECDAFCESPDNLPSCIAFAKEAGLMSEEEQANAEKMLQAIRNGAKPPACRGKEECDAYCSVEANFEECIEFGKAAGFMTDEEYQMAKKTGGKGPGGCRGKEECDAFCSSTQENEELCINFQVEKGLMSEDRKREMEEDGNRFRQSFTNMSPEVAACLSDAWGAENFEKLKAGTMRPTRWLGDAMPTCFSQYEQQRMQNDRPSGPPPENSVQQSSFGRPPESGQQYSGPRPEGAFRCEGESCRPPEGFMPPDAYRQQSGGQYPPCEGLNCRPPEGFMPPQGQYGPPEGNYPSCEGENCQQPIQQMAPTDSAIRESTGSFPLTPTESFQPISTEPQPEVIAPAESAAPTQEAAPAISPESFAGAVILFLNSLF